MDTTNSNNNILLCQASTGQEDDWKNLYESAFPQDERMPAEEIRQLLSRGAMMLHKTQNKSGALVCFSLVFPVTDFLLLSYIATDPAQRSGGYGSKHMRQLIALMKAQFPSHLGFFLEIESTREKGLDPEVQKVRNRRLDFYQRLGAKRLCNRNYLWPNLGQPGGPTRQGELLWFEFGTTAIDDTVLPRVIREIYERAYNLPASDPLIAQVLAQFTPAAASSQVCATPAAAASAAAPQPGPDGTSAATAAGDKPADPPAAR